MMNGILVAILVLVLFAAVRYLVKMKSKGARCIGCPSGDCCSSKTQCTCGMEQETKKEHSMV